MKRLFLSLFLFVIALQAGAQQPVRVTHEVTPEGVIEFIAEIEPGYYMYSTDIPKGGPKPTYVKFSELEGVELVGELVPLEEPMSKYESVFNMQVTYFEEYAVFAQKIKVLDENFFMKGTLHYQSCGAMGCVPGRYDFTISNGEVAVAPAAQVGEGDAASEVVAESKPADAEIDPWSPVEMPKKSSHSSIWVTFILGFGGGLLALLTPCVWPIIPMTVSFFLKRSKAKKEAVREALIYGASIVVIYLLLGLAVTLIFGPAALNELATNAFFNVFFFLMLLVFGASFLGGFEIKLPSSWTNKVDEKAGNTTGMLSIFLMAFTLALVSFSCTGPIIGFLLVETATSGDIFAPAVGMFGFALSLALPFTLFAIFPSLLKQTPRSGGWMNTIKVVLGFVEIAFALKFLSVADLTKGWGILDRETFLALWIGLFILLGMYLLKIIRMPHDDPSDRNTSVTGFFGALLSFAFAVYMIPGLWGAPCKAISAFAPPMFTQDFSMYDNTFKSDTHDYDEAIRMSREQNKPIFLDFTGHGCVNCREMETAVLGEAAVLDILQKDYIVASLYVDDRALLDEPFVGKDGLEYNEVGEKWSYLQQHKFGELSQPFYVLVDSNGQPLNGSFAFKKDVGDFVDFLKEGLKNYKR
ncbi:MAG: thioredoxin family protein [Bacteroidaceae bacterium]|nr:thioredoxin family protein [Bacteroidaceae bacterium]